MKSQPTVGAPAIDTTVGTRERILEVVLELFIRKGYAATSMREIAAPLGISKAALYYHFPSKAHIMLELHLQMHRATADLQDIPGPGADDATWLRFLDRLIGLALRNRRLIEVHFRNRDMFEEVHEGPLLEEHARSHQERPIEAALMALFMDRSGTEEARVRRLASVGVVASALFGSAAVSDIPDAELERIVRSIARGVADGDGGRDPVGAGRRAHA
jgi:AcrR family transcriptional regulator